MRFRHFVRSAVIGAVIGLGVAVLPATPAALAQAPAGPAADAAVAAELSTAPGADVLAVGAPKPGRTNPEASDSSALAALAVIVLAVIVAVTAAVGARRSSSR